MKPIYQYLIVSIFSMCLGFAYRFHLPQIKLWILSSIHVYSYEKLPVVIHPENAEISLIPLKLEIKNVSIRSNKNQLPELRKLDIKNIELKPDFLALLLGQAKLSEIAIESARMVVITKNEPNVKPKQKTNIDLPSPKAFEKILKSIPVSKVSIKDFNYYARYNQWNLSNLISGIELNINKFNNNVFVDFNLPHFKVKDSNNDTSLSEFSVSSKLMLTQSNIRLETLRIHREDSFVDLQFIANNWLEERRKYKAELRTNLDLKQSRKLIMRFDPSLKLPDLTGRLETNIKVDSQDLNQIEAKFLTKKLSIDGFKVGELSSEVFATESSVELKQLEVKNNLNHILAPEIKFNKTTDNKWLVDSKIDIKSFELRQLLQDIKVGDTPLRLDANAKSLACAGEITPEFNLDCSGKLNVDYFRVFNPENDFTIHSFKNASVEGQVKINTTGVYPSGNISLGKANGSAKGFVEYQKGFSFQYETDNFSFTDIESLAELPIEGQLKIKGSTEGNSKAATIDMNIDAANISLFKYNFGAVKSKLNYKAGKLSFSNMKTGIGRSQLFGKLEVNLLKSKIRGRFSSKQLYLNDAYQIVQNNLSLPVEFKGFGTSYINFEGPLQFNALNYDLIYKADSIRIQDENFENLQVNLRARKGFLKSRILEAQKGLGKVFGRLEMNPEYDLKIDLKTEKLNLADVNFTEKLGGNIQAQLDARALVSGRIPDLNYEVESKITDLDIGGVNLQDSDLKYQVDDKSQRLVGSLFGNSLAVDTNIPTDKSGDFHLKMKATDFNFTALFSLLGINTSQIGFKSSLSGTVDLRSKSGGLWNSSGRAEIDSLTLSRGPLSLQANKALVIKATDGLFRSDEWNVSGDGTDLNYQVLPTHGGKLNSSIQGTLNLSLISFAIPFVDNLRGDLSLSTRLTGSLEEPKLSGSAFLKNASFLIPGLPHPFERIQSDVIFSNNKIIINKIDSEIAGGKLVGDGQIELAGLTNIPTNINANLSNARLEIIEGLSFLTNASLNLNGSWFPFKLKANANITSGKISPKASGTSVSKVRPSQYLPELLLEKSFDPIILDVDAFLNDKVLIDVAELQSFVKGNMSLDGPVGNPTYNGELSLVPGGTLFFRDTPFNIETGNIRFRNTKKINPSFYVDASTSILEQASQTNYDVNITVRGDLDNFTTKLDSQPVLSETDLISLLALGLTSEQLDKQSVENQRDLQMMEIGAAVISNSPLGKELKDRTGFTFKLSTDIDEKDSTQYKVVISKKVTPNMEASASILGNNAKKDVRLEYKLNKDLSLVGSWESTTFDEASDTSIDQEQKSDIFGLDLRYKVEFK